MLFEKKVYKISKGSYMYHLVTKMKAFIQTTFRTCNTFPWSFSLVLVMGSVSMTKRKFHRTHCCVLGIMWDTVIAAHVNVTGMCCGFSA
jgi:hypothetical protein